MDKHKILYLQRFDICLLISGTHIHCLCTTCQKTGSCEEVVVVLKLLSHPRPRLVVPWFRKYLNWKIVKGGIWRFYQSILSFLPDESLPFFPLQTWPCSLFKTRIHLNILRLYNLFDMTIIVLLFSDDDIPNLIESSTLWMERLKLSSIFSDNKYSFSRRQIFRFPANKYHSFDKTTSKFASTNNLVH